MFLDEIGVLKFGKFHNCCKIDHKIPIPDDQDFLNYIAPELIEDDGIPSFASDFFSLGCLMYRMASGIAPFAGTSFEEFQYKINCCQVARLQNYSHDLNNLILNLLKKNPYDRLTWPELVKDKFWKSILQERDNQEFDNFDRVKFPKQPLFEQSRGKPRNNYQPPKSNPQRSLNSSQNSVKSSFNFTTTEKKIIIFSLDNFILQSDLLKPTSMIFNQQIENFQNFPTKVSGSLSINMIKTEDPDVFSKSLMKIKEQLNQGQPTIKVSIIQFLIINSKDLKVANNFIKSSFFPEILNLANELTSSNVSSHYLLFFGTILRYANDYSVLNQINFKPLQDLCQSTQEAVSRKAVACVGELARIFSSTSSFKVPDFIPKLLLQLLSNPDEITRHYSVRSVANVLLSYNFFKISEVEKEIFNFNYSDSPCTLR